MPSLALVNFTPDGAREVTTTLAPFSGLRVNTTLKVSVGPPMTWDTSDVPSETVMRTAGSSSSATLAAMPTTLMPE